MKKVQDRNRNQRPLYQLLMTVFVVVCWVWGCGGGGSSGAAGGETGNTATSFDAEGIFVDGIVEGLGYHTGTYSGTTDGNGTFNFNNQESVTFSIGDIVLGTATAHAMMTPIDLVPEATDERHPAVVNIARLVQALDDDGIIADTIRIPPGVQDELKGIGPVNFNQSAEDFSKDPAVLKLFSTLNASGIYGARTVALGTSDDALLHFQGTLAQHPKIKIKSPNGGERIEPLETYEITWQAPSHIENVRIFLSQDSGSTWRDIPIVESTDNDGSYLWGPISMDCSGTHSRLRIVDAANLKTLDDANADFTIQLSLGKVAEMIEASTSGDSDGDYLPDDVEQMLGTDPNSPDTDRDGIFDYAEIFPSKDYNPSDPLADQDNDGLMAALDSDENGDNTNDGAFVDTDGDGIANYLEYFGYTYDWLTDSYALWDGISVNRPYFKSDPLQPSTDQDPYSDDMEASGAMLDVLVDSPGDLPMVPAYPNLVVKLESYEVTLNSEITSGQGGSFSSETTWSRETGNEESTTWTHGWEVGGGVKLGTESGVEVTGSYSGSWSGTNTSSTTSSRGGSITSEENWQTATSANPAEAARVKLKLKVYNLGTAAASNILPTLTLKIGGMSVLTFAPTNPIHILEPGGIYPIQDNTYWVVDKSDGDGSPITITMEELRALESGAPISVEVTQMSADVMLMNGTGQWESAGPWSEYMARCEAVCTNVLLEMGDGSFIHYLVYSDDAITSPNVTFRDALNWVAGAHDSGGDTLISYRDATTGFTKSVSLDDWHFTVDTDTLLDNGFTFDSGIEMLQPPGLDFSMDNLVLGPDTTIIGKVPRQIIADSGPDIHYAYLDAREGLVMVCASDYRGLAGATFVDKSGNTYPMDEVIDGSGIYAYNTYNIDGTYYEGACSGNQCAEKVIITGSDGVTAEANLMRLEYPDKDPVSPDIVAVSYDLGTGLISANINEDPDSPCKTVWAYHPNYPQESIEMTRSQEFWNPQEVTKWYGSTPAHWGLSAADLPELTVIAEVDDAHEYYDTQKIGSSVTCPACEQGVGSVYTYVGFFVVYWEWEYHAIDFDVPGSSVKKFKTAYDKDSYDDKIGQGYEVIWATAWESYNVLYFDTPWVRWSDIDPLATSVSAADIATIADSDWNDPGKAWSGTPDTQPQAYQCTNLGDIYDTYVLKAGESNKYIVFKVTGGDCRSALFTRTHLTYEYIIY